MKKEEGVVVMWRTEVGLEGKNEEGILVEQSRVRVESKV